MRQMIELFAPSALLCAACAAWSACAAAPRPTPELLRIRANAPAIVEGRVRDEDGVPAAGITVRGIPRGRDIPWSAPATTDCDGRFRLSLAAPGSYGFLLDWKGRAIITPSPRDPALSQIAVEPGQTRSGIELEFLGAPWRRIATGTPAQTPSCR